MKRVKVALGAAIAAALGAIAATVWVGAQVREETVVAKPYEEGLGLDAERRARAALGLALSIAEVPGAGGGPLVFELSDRAGRPVADVAVTVEISRPETSRGAQGVPARAEGGGRYVADIAFPDAGPWDVRFDVARGSERVRLERRVEVQAACDLSAGPCTRPLAGGGSVTLELSPRPLRAMAELGVRVQVVPPHPDLPRGAPGSERLAGRAGDTTREAGAAAAAGERVEVSFAMPGMDMGANRAMLVATGGGRHEGTAVLVRCPSGRRAWVADVTVASEAAPRTARFPLTVAE